MGTIENIERWRQNEIQRIENVAEGFVFLSSAAPHNGDRIMRAPLYVLGAQIAYGERVDTTTVSHFVLEATKAGVLHRSEYEIQGKRSMGYRDGLYGKYAVTSLLLAAVDLGVLLSSNDGELSVPSELKPKMYT